MGRNRGSERSEVDENTTVQRRYDWATATPSIAIVEAIAGLTACEPIDVAPLFGVTDPDAIDALLTSDEGTHDPQLTVTVRLDQYEVTVHRDGTVTVSSIAGEPEAAETGS